jgi:hypothetical protein
MRGMDVTRPYCTLSGQTATTCLVRENLGFPYSCQIFVQTIRARNLVLTEK